MDELWATATDTEYGTTSERFAYYRCPSCDCLSIDPLPADRLEEIYPPTYYSFASPEAQGRVTIAERVKAWLDRRSFRRAAALIGSDSPRILDVGGGVGAISGAFVRASGGRATATVVDIDPKSVEAAKARGLEGVACRFEDFETDRRFDLVLMLNLVEHVADPIALLRKARGLLEPGGLVWLQTPNFRALDGRVFRHHNWAGYHCPRHWVIFSETGLPRALSAAGLEPAWFTRAQGGAFWAASLLGLPRASRPPSGPELPRPLVCYRSFMPLAAAGAAFDLMTRRVRAVSQVVILARVSNT
ncbi:MAG: class I SAM-dependent methyltransferase [Actinomycetota bacterium]